MTRHKNSIALFNVKNDYFKNLFFSSNVNEWESLDPNLRNSESLTLFKKSILAFIRPVVNTTFSNFHYDSQKGLKRITRLRLGLGDLGYKFNHSFQDPLNPICDYGIVENTIHYLRHCPNSSNERLTLPDKTQSIGEKSTPTFQKCLAIC